MKKLTLIPLLSLIFMLNVASMCSDDNDSTNSADPTPVINTVNQGTWRITFYEDSGVNETSNFTGYNFTLEEIREGKLVAKLSADRIVWDTAINSWSAKNWRMRVLHEGGEYYTVGESLDTLLSITPNDFDLPINHHETLKLPALNRQIKVLEERGADNVNFYKIEKYVRFMSPFAAVILTFIGVIVSAKKTRGGSGFQIALGFMLAFVYIILFLLSRTFAEAGTAYPILAVWIPNIVFAATGLVLYKTVPR